jgi:hypothetical protein
MYTSAGDVEVGEAPTSTETAAEDEVQDSASPDDAAEVTNPAQEEAEQGTEEETAAEEAEGEATEGEEAAADAPAETSETVPAEEGPADEEPDSGVGAVSTEEETDGAGAEGITADPEGQEGLPEASDTGDGAEAAPAEGEQPTSTTAEGEEILETPEGLDTSVDGAPEAEETGGESADLAEAAEAATEETAAADGGEAPARVDPGPALRANAPETTAPADLDALLDPEALDVDAVTAAIRASDLEEAEQTQLVEALTTAQGSPDLLPAVLDRIRTALLGE